MTQSAEYPDLAFVPPAAYGHGRDGKAVRYIVVHYTAGAERNTSAEDGAAYDQRRDDGTSTHYFIDPDSVVQCVLTTDRANACFHKGNRLGIQYEFCGTAQTRGQWLDAASDAILTNAAKQIARDCLRYEIPVRRLTVAETREAWYSFPKGPKGIVGHVDVTRAYPEDGGDHTDPGTEFPWDVLLPRVQHYVDGGEDDMYEQYDRDRVTSTWEQMTALTDALKRLSVDIGELKSLAAAVAARPVATLELSPEILGTLSPIVESAVRKVLADAANPDA